MTNAEIAAAFDRLALLYELDGAVRYRVLAYKNAANAIRDSGTSVEKLAREGRATSLEGVGETIEQKIVALLDEGEIPAARELLERYPPGLLEVTRVPGLGAKTARRLFEELEVASLDDLKRAAEAEEIRNLKGMGPKAEGRILEELARIEARGGDEAERTLLSDILPVAEALAEVLREHPAADRVEIAGSARRMADTCKDIDLIATSEDGEALAEHLAGLDLIATAGSPTASGVHAETHGGIPVDLRVVEPASFGNLLQHFTGSGYHNVQLRERAVAEGLSVSEHGVERSSEGDTLRCETEAQVYEALGYSYIPPELREGRGELDAAREGRLPDLIGEDRIRGELHCHTTLSDGKAELGEMEAAARERGYAYLAITDHSASHGFGNHVTDKRLRERIEEIRARNEELEAAGEDFRLLAGSEVNIAPDGSLDYPDEVLDELDWVIASVHSAFSGDERKMTDRVAEAVANPRVNCIGHLTGRLIGKRDPYPVDVDRLFELAERHGTMFEINGNPRRRDLSDVHARLAAEAGVKIVLTTDAHSVPGLGMMSYAVATARRAWLEAADIANTRGLADFRSLLGVHR